MSSCVYYKIYKKKPANEQMYGIIKAINLNLWFLINILKKLSCETSLLSILYYVKCFLTARYNSSSEITTEFYFIDSWISISFIYNTSHHLNFMMTWNNNIANKNIKNKK